MAAYLDSCFIMHDGQVKKYCHFADFGQVKKPLQCVKIQYNPFSIIVMTPRGTFELCCVYTAQLMTHTAIHTLPFTLQLCYKPLGILERVTKSQKVHISSL